jgi:uncharacterized protein (TIGR02594 family)
MEMSEPAWLVEARKDLGLQEGAGASDNPRVVKMFADAGHPEIKHDSVAWCAAAIGAWLHRAGLEGTGSLLALSYLKWGQPLAKPMLGAIAVKKRVGGGHVTLVVGKSGNFVYCLGGNQSDAVTIAAYDASVFSYRWPDGVALTKTPLPTNIRDARAGVSEA